MVSIANLKGNNGRCAQSDRLPRPGDRVRRFYVGAKHECFMLVDEHTEAQSMADAVRLGVVHTVPAIEVVE